MTVPSSDATAVQGAGSSVDGVAPEQRTHTPPAQPASARKTRVALACKRCKRRKQRCDGAHPVCKSCNKAGAPCIYERNYRPQYPGGKSLYINALEERIAFLEARLPAYAEDHFSGASSNPRRPSDHDTEDGARFRQRLDSSSSHRGSVSEDIDGEDRNSIVDGVAYLSLCASGATDSAPEPFYLGSSSGAAIARMIQRSIFKNPRARTSAALDGEASSGRHQHSSPRAATASTLTVLPEDSSYSSPSLELPFKEQARLLFDVFFDRMHTRWPILDRKAYSALFEKQYDSRGGGGAGALSITQRSIMHLIYAIAARFLQLTRKPCGVEPEQHLLAAIEPMDYILEQHNLATVQFLLLLAVHGQRSPYGAGAWTQVRYAVSLCIELGLHRERRGPPRDARGLELRRRAFWGCYSLDRATSVVLGRAFAISDRDINVALPSPSVDFWDLTHKEPLGSVHHVPTSNIEPFIHIIKLEMIQSRIHRTVFRVDKDVFSGPVEGRARLEQKMTDIRAELDNWIKTIPRPPRGFHKITWLYDPESASQDSQDFFNLQYHKTILMLFSVLLPGLAPTDHRFIATARSAACVCVAYKRLNQAKTLTYTMISLHSTFVAGLTLVYCVWRDRSLFSYDVIEATQACSQSLTIFGEKWAGAVKYRDIFDALSGSLFKTLVGPLGMGCDVAGLDKGRSGPTGARISAPEEAVAPANTTTSATDRVEDEVMAEPSMRSLMSDAVKEAFMEVDEEVPGAWQGWRMWTDMVGEQESAQAAAVAAAADANMVPRDEQVEGRWGSLSGEQGLHGDVGDMQTDHFSTVETSDWDFGSV